MTNPLKGRGHMGLACINGFYDTSFPGLERVRQSQTDCGKCGSSTRGWPWLVSDVGFAPAWALIAYRFSARDATNLMHILQHRFYTATHILRIKKPRRGGDLDRKVRKLPLLLLRRVDDENVAPLNLD